MTWRLIRLARPARLNTVPNGTYRKATVSRPSRLARRHPSITARLDSSYGETDFRLDSCHWHSIPRIGEGYSVNTGTRIFLLPHVVRMPSNLQESSLMCCSKSAHPECASFRPGSVL